MILQHEWREENPTIAERAELQPFNTRKVIDIKSLQTMQFGSCE